MSILIMLQIYIQGNGGLLQTLSMSKQTFCYRIFPNVYFMWKDMVCYDCSFKMVCHSFGAHC